MAVLTRIELTEIMVNPDPSDPHGWSAGSQLEALRYYTDPKAVTILATHMDSDYQGDCYAVLVVRHRRKVRYVLWRDSFGSCSGCDSLEGQNGYAYVKDTLQEGNTRQFRSIVDLREYVRTSEDYSWGVGREKIEAMLEKGAGDDRRDP